MMLDKSHDMDIVADSRNSLKRVEFTRRISPSEHHVPAVGVCLAAFSGMWARCTNRPRLGSLHW